MFSVLMRQHLGGLRLGAGVAALAGLVGLGSISEAANVTRIYDFEDGVIGQTASSLTDAFDEFSFADAPDTVLNIPSDWIEVGGATPRPGALVGQNMRDAIDPIVNIAPALEPFSGGVATYVDATQFGTPAGGWAGISAVSGEVLDGFGSPAGAISGSDMFDSNIAIRFNGSGGYDDFNTGGGAKGLYIGDDAYANNLPIDGQNVGESFSLLSQAWIYPESSAQGTEQIVYQMGAEFGTVVISEEGTWRVDGIRGGLAPIDEGTPVEFDEWTHVSVLRGGGGATLIINGNVIGTRDGFFNTWPSVISLGAGEFDEAPFTGLIDNFIISGVGDGLGVALARDFETGSDYFVSGDAPTGVQGDVDGDGDADSDDYQIWADNVGSVSGAGNALTYVTGDINGPAFDGSVGEFVAGDGRVNFVDFVEIANAVRDSSAGSTIPEPVGFALALSAVVGAVTSARSLRRV